MSDRVQKPVPQFEQRMGVVSLKADKMGGQGSRVIARGAEMVYTATFDQLVTDLMRDRHMTRPQAEAAAKQTAGTAALGFAQHWADKSVQKTEARIQKEGYAGYVPGPNTHQKSGERPTKPVSEKAKAARAAHAEVRDGANVIGRDLAFEACIAALDLGR